MRKKIVAGNWKMFGSRHEARALLSGIKHGAAAFSAIDIVVFPSFVHLQETETMLAETRIAWGGQNNYIGESGAFTGEVSVPMLADYGCRYALVGHSERRLLFREDLELVSNKFKAVLEYGLQPVLCLGETQAEREKNATETVIKKQLESVVEAAGIGAFSRAVIAYEPVWAIGTGLTASPEEAEAVHAMIREQLGKHSVDVAETMRILYGGSVKPDNAKALFAMPNIDGGLVGGASLKAESFLSICDAAASLS